jgi:hypothetical protein
VLLSSPVAGFVTLLEADAETADLIRPLATEREIAIQAPPPPTAP